MKVERIMAETKTRLLVLGASGMLGNALLRTFAFSPEYEAWGTVRSDAARQLLPSSLRDRVAVGIDMEKRDDLGSLLCEVRPDVVINCIGLVKQLAVSEDHVAAITINSLLPHRLARTCEGVGARFVQISTDCVFAGTGSMYTEEDFADAPDLYGRSKYLGEVDYPHAITLRTSIIGHELATSHGLIAWFLAQRDGVKGFTKAVFSGLPTVELARVARDFVLPHPELHGVYHVSAEPISKYDLLRLVARTYGKHITITPDDGVAIDRSLDSTRFRRLTGYKPPQWAELVRAMHEFG